jgi:hypothetical protein
MFGKVGENISAKFHFQTPSENRSKSQIGVTGAPKFNQGTV